MYHFPKQNTFVVIKITVIQIKRSSFASKSENRNHKMKKNYLTTALFLVIILAGCQSNRNKTTGDRSVKVKVMQVLTDKSISSGYFSGTVEEENGTTLSFSVTGTVEKVHFHLGQHVAKGQLLATLDPGNRQHSYPHPCRAATMPPKPHWNRQRIATAV